VGIITDTAGMVTTIVIDTIGMGVTIIADNDVSIGVIASIGE
jgi:hypothetical protein